jgi:NAD+ synthase (glutamine-hydrolysing)
VDTYRAGFGEATHQKLAKLPLENLQARLRGTIVTEYSNQFGHLLLTTGNKSEISVGYCTLCGDTAGGLGPIGELYKTEIFALSRHLNDSAGREVIPQAIIDKPPSAELAPNQLDTDSLPPYEVLDEILKVLIEGPRLAPAERARAESAVAHLRETAQGRETIARVQSMISRSEYKRRQAAPGFALKLRWSLMICIDQLTATPRQDALALGLRQLSSMYALLPSGRLASRADGQPDRGWIATSDLGLVVLPANSSNRHARQDPVAP